MLYKVIIIKSANFNQVKLKGSNLNIIIIKIFSTEILMIDGTMNTFDIEYYLHFLARNLCHNAIYYNFLSCFYKMIDILIWDLSQFTTVMKYD